MFKSGLVAIIGRPNVGKSTLINRLVGEKLAIISEKPQTTRNKITCILTTKEAQIIFLDTPGLHKPRHKLGEYMVRVSLKALKEVDIILLLVEASQFPGGGDRYIIDLLKEVKTPVFLVLNKMDLVKKRDMESITEKYQELYSFAQVIGISALQGENTALLVDKLIEYLPEGPQYYPEDMITDQPERFLVSELIREKILELTRDEVPHSVAVEVEEMKKRGRKNLVYISATIYVERDSQKGILLGKGGKMLKEIGSRARKDIEWLIGSKIYLELWVKVKKDWRNKEKQLKYLGYGDK